MLREIAFAIAVIVPLQAEAGDWKIYNPNGTVSGRAEERPYGGALYDRDGRRQGWVEERPYGGVIYDSSGHRIGTVEKSDRNNERDATNSRLDDEE